MPWQPWPKMHVQLEVSQVRSHRNTWSASAGSTNSTHARGKTRSTSGTRQPSAPVSERYTGSCPGTVVSCGPDPGNFLAGTARRAAVAGIALEPHAPRRPRHRIQHRPPARGGRPPRVPRRCRRTRTRPLRLAEHLDQDGRVGRRGVEALTEFVGRRRSSSPRTRAARRSSAFATSAIRDAPNGEDVLAQVREKSGRRHPGAARGGRGAADLPGRTPLVRLVVGAAGGLRHRRRVAGDRGRCRRGARRRVVAAARRRAADPRALRRRPARRGRSTRAAQAVRAEIAATPGTLLRGGAPDRAVATSKTFRSLARICGAAPSERRAVRAPRR